MTQAGWALHRGPTDQSRDCRQQLLFINASCGWPAFSLALGFACLACTFRGTWPIRTFDPGRAIATLMSMFALAFCHGWGRIGTKRSDQALESLQKSPFISSSATRCCSVLRAWNQWAAHPHQACSLDHGFLRLAVPPGWPSGPSPHPVRSFCPLTRQTGCTNEFWRGI